MFNQHLKDFSVVLHEGFFFNITYWAFMDDLTWQFNGCNSTCIIVSSVKYISISSLGIILSKPARHLTVNSSSFILWVYGYACATHFLHVNTGMLYSRSRQMCLYPTVRANASLWLWINNSACWHRWVEPLLFMVGIRIDRWLLVILRSTDACFCQVARQSSTLSSFSPAFSTHQPSMLLTCRPCRVLACPISVLSICENPSLSFCVICLSLYALPNVSGYVFFSSS